MKSMLKSSLNAMFFILIGAMAVSVLVTIYLITLGHTLEPNLYTAPALVGGLLGLFFFFWHIKTDQIRARLVHLNIVFICTVSMRIKTGNKTAAGRCAYCTVGKEVIENCTLLCQRIDVRRLYKNLPIIRRVSPLPCIDTNGPAA